MDSIETVLSERGGVARRADLLRAKIGRRAIERAVERGLVLRVRKGVYALASCSSDVITAAKHGGELACVDALRSHGVWVPEESESADEPFEGAASEGAKPQRTPHVWIGASNRQHRHRGCTCRVHHEQGDGTPAFGVVAVWLALLQFAVCASEERFFVAYESALNLRILTRLGLRELHARLPYRCRWIIDFARDDAESGLESLLRYRLHLLGIELQSQVWIDGVGRVDFVLDGRIILEVDGRLNHDGPSKRHKDLIRDAAAASLGYETLRFDYAMVVHDWAKVVAAILGRMHVSRSAPRGH